MTKKINNLFDAQLEVLDVKGELLTMALSLPRGTISQELMDKFDRLSEVFTYLRERYDTNSTLS